MRLIASDYDGTVSIGPLEQRRCAVSDWQTAGNKFGIVSGRCMQDLLVLLERDGVQCDFFIASNGMLILDGTGSVLWEQKCPGTWLGEILPFIYGSGCIWCFIHSDQCYVGNYPQDQTTLPCVSVEEASKIPFFYQFSAVCDSNENAAKLVNALREEYAGWVNPLQNGHTVDIIGAGMDKAQGIRKLLNLWRQEEKAVIAVGDNFNDLPMIADFYSYAMESAPDTLKRIANHVTPDVVAMINNELKR